MDQFWEQMNVVAKEDNTLDETVAFSASALGVLLRGIYIEVQDIRRLLEERADG